MKTRIYISILSLALILWTANLFSQAVRPEKVITPIAFDISKKLIDVEPITPGYTDRSWKEKVIPNEEGFLDEFKQEAAWKGPDPVLQESHTKAISASATIGQNFPGQVNTSGVAPPDINGDVSAGYYMQMVNLSFQIWNKNGTSLYGPAYSSTLWNGFTGPWTGTNDGDPIVLYDPVADRWIATQFSLPNYPSGPFYELVAVSTSNNPGGTWYRYAYQFTNMPDYPKFGVWPDGYYLTVNQFAPPSLGFAGAAVCVLNRAAMIAGSPTAQMLFFNMGTSYGSILPADFDGSTMPPAGSPNYLANLGSNSLHIWKAAIDWTTTANSSVTLINTLTPQSFSYSNIRVKQPGTSQTLDPLSDRLMHRLQYRKFATYEVMLTNHTVNADGKGQAGVRWYELRNTGAGWFIYQQGTYAPADGNGRWMGSVAMNGNGDIGIGYSVSGSSTYPSIRFSGQSAANKGTGILDITESSIVAGAKSQTGVSRWGDYSMMAIDPSDDATFWYTNEYSNGGWNWKTQIASFTFQSPVVQAPVADFSGNPTSITAGQQVNFTDLSTNNPTSWSWSFPGGTPSASTLQNPVVTYNNNSTYDVSLTATNSAGSNSITKTNYITVSPPPAYCTSAGSNTSYEWIKSINVGGYTNNSGPDGGYGDYTSIIINLPGGNTSISLNPGFSGRSRGEYWRIWIDFNNDMDFNDAGELVFSANRVKGSVSGTVTIPSGFTSPTRMRISMKYDAAPTACEMFTYGEVEDYTVSFSPPLAPGPGTITPGSIASASLSGEKSLTMEIYPNPASEMLNVVLTGASETFNIKVYNSLGQVINDFNVKNSRTAINLSNYKKGLYYVGADDGNQTVLKKFIRE
jgi:PKD repeat protein